MADTSNVSVLAKDCDTNLINPTDVPEISVNTAVNVNRKAGYAQIKQEFLIHDYKPVLQTEYLSSEMKGKLDCVDKDSHSHADDSEKAPADDESEPPHKKIKMKGRNKNRPKSERLQDKDRLCPAVKDNKVCKFGDRCKFSHDKEDFVNRKLPELTGSCYNFDTFGLCQYGISCRFAKNHMTSDLQNVKNEELYNKTKDLKFLNELSFDLRNKLWKRNFDFKKSDRIVKDVEQVFKRRDAFTNSTNVHNPIVTVSKNEIVNTAIQSLHPVTNLVDSPSSCNDLNPKPAPEVVPAQTNCSTHTEVLPVLPTNKSETVTFSDTPDITITTENVKLPPLLDDKNISGQRTLGCITDEEIIRLRPSEIKKIDFKNKLYLAPLTTVGNLPFRRICKSYGADITCGEMALVTQLLKAKQSEWSLIKRHPSEDLFGVQICGSYPDTMTRCAQLLTETCSVDFIDINCGCPIDMIYEKGCGSALMGKGNKLEQICRSMTGVMGNTPLTVKLRTGVFDNKNVAHNILPRLRDAGVSLVTVHGRSREQRYTKLADWNYISQCSEAASPMPVFGNGDIMSFEEANLHMSNHGVSGVMIARGAIIKPWIFTEIKEQRHWDISAGERLDLLRTYSNYGLEHWGSDYQGVENTRRFLLEWLSFLHRYIPVGVLEQIPQSINQRPPYYVGRNDLETLMASANCADWIKISEMLLGPVPPNFQFLPKHKANAYQ